MNDNIVLRASVYVAQLLLEKQPKSRVFHNLHHTLTVLEGAGKISRKENVSKEELEIVLLAAAFHDSGHVECYKGHEAVSQRIAKKWLTEQNYSKANIKLVLGCIAVTELPQRPKNLLEEILCDADLIHLSYGSYPIFQELLRAKWETELGLVYSNEDWIASNNKFLESHKYHTNYGKTVLEQNKIMVSKIIYS